MFFMLRRLVLLLLLLLALGLLLLLLPWTNTIATMVQKKMFVLYRAQGTAGHTDDKRGPVLIPILRRLFVSSRSIYTETRVSYPVILSVPNLCSPKALLSVHLTRFSCFALCWCGGLLWLWSMKYNASQVLQK